MNRPFAIVAGVLALALPAMAAAQPEAKLRQTVAYGDLNLKTRAGMSTMRRRLHSAAANICTQETGASGDIGADTVYGRCVTRAMDHAMRRLQNQTAGTTVQVSSSDGALASR